MVIDLKDNYRSYKSQADATVLIATVQRLAFNYIEELETQALLGNSGIQFQVRLIFYKFKKNENGKMRHKVYIDPILEPVV